MQHRSRTENPTETWQPRTNGEPHAHSVDLAREKAPHFTRAARTFPRETMLKCMKVIASEQLTEGRMEQHVQAASMFKASHHRQDGIRNCDCHQEMAAALQVSPRRLQTYPAAAEHDVLHLCAEHESATRATMAQAVPHELQSEGAAVRAEERGQRRVQVRAQGGRRRKQRCVGTSNLHARVVLTHQ